MGQGPLTTRDIKRPKGMDALQTLKRRVAAVARLEREVVYLGPPRARTPMLVRVRRWRDAPAIVQKLRTDGWLDAGTLEKSAELEAPLSPIAPSFYGAMQHELVVLGSRSMLAHARENRRALARHGAVDEEWIVAKEARLEAIRQAPPPAHWTDTVCALVRAHRGAGEADAVARGFATLFAAPMDRRAKALDRVLAIARAVESTACPDADDAELALLAERLDACRDFPGRARKRRVLDVLRRAIGWAELPAALVDEDDFVASARRAIALWPISEDDALTARFAVLALSLRLGDGGVPALDGLDDARIGKLARFDLTLEQAATIVRLDKNGKHHHRLAQHVAGGLDLELLRAASDDKQLAALAEQPNVRAARAFATWSMRFADHYKEKGVKLTLSPHLFANLPKNEDLAVLTLCLLDHHAEPSADPIATLDATLGLFARHPFQAKSILERLVNGSPGIGRLRDPAFADWLRDGDDGPKHAALLDRAVHIAELAGQPAISNPIREDFEHLATRIRERDYLAGLETRSSIQQLRFEYLAQEHTVRRERTIRRLRARGDNLLPIAYKRELDRTFLRLLDEAWGIRLGSLTPSWREAVRFWLTVEDNRPLFDTMLREAAKRPGASVKDAFPANVEWAHAMRQKIDVAAWCAPYRRVLTAGDATFTIAVEDDPLEVLRMGIPFGTCLSFDGCNAASTVANAVEINKRVIYVRNAHDKIVARKLIAMTDDGRLVGYRLYRSIADGDGAIRDAIASLCSDIAAAARAPLAATGTPRVLHRGAFWYDDGETSFAHPAAAIPAFCAAHGLAAPLEDLDDDDALEKEAAAWHARATNDVTAALAVLKSYGDTPATRLHDAWTIARLGIRRATELAKAQNCVAFALFRYLGEDEPGLLRALEIASRIPENRADCRLYPVLSRFPASPRIAAGLVELARRAMRYERSYCRGHGSVTLLALPHHFTNVAGALDLLDAIEPAWRALATKLPAAEKKIVADGVERAIAKIEEIYEQAPEPAVVVTALLSRHRGEYAHRAALRIAARHVLSGGERAFRRFVALRPELMTTGDAFAALLRQAGGRAPEVPIPVPAEKPFASMRELVARLDVGRFLGKWSEVEGETKCPWELAWRQRQVATPYPPDDAVPREVARRALIDPATPPGERERARTLVFGAPDGIDWMRLATQCARIGDLETTCRVLDEALKDAKNVSLSPAVIVALWHDGERGRATLGRVVERTRGEPWYALARAAEREAAARGVDAGGLLEAIGLGLANILSPAECVLPDTLAQLQIVLPAVVAKSEPDRAAQVFLHLEDALSVVIFRDALAKQPPERVTAVKEAIRKLDLSSARSKAFWAWVQGGSVRGIETA